MSDDFGSIGSIVAAIAFPFFVWMTVMAYKEYGDIKGKKRKKRKREHVFVVVFLGVLSIVLFVPALKGYFFILVILGAVLGLLA